MNENETPAPCEAYATAVIPVVGNTEVRLDEITAALGKLAEQLTVIGLRLDLLEGAAGYETEVRTAGSENSAPSEIFPEEIAEATASESAPTFEEEELKI